MHFINLPGLFSIVTLVCCLCDTAEGLEGEAIIGGNSTIPGEIKYIVSLQRNGKSVCSGGIIGEQFILTAAHCVIDKATDNFKTGRLKVVAATNDLNADDPSKIEVDVESIYVPNDYNSTHWKGGYPKGDIAVLKLTKGLNLTSNQNLQKLHLPMVNNSNPQDNSPYINSRSEVAGYGWDKIGIIRYSNGTKRLVGSSSYRLLKAEVAVIDHLACRRYFKIVWNSNLCARVVNYEDKTRQGVCKGDSGSPLVYKNRIVIGVVSGSIPTCNDNKSPSLYTRVASYTQFIKNVKRGLTNDMRVHVVSSDGIFRNTT